MLNLCARESKARTGRFRREKLINDHDRFLPTRADKERRTGKIRKEFSVMHRALDGCWLVRRLHQLKASTTMDLGISIFLFFCMMCGLEKFGCVDQNCLERDLFALLLRTLAVGRRQQSESIGVALDIME